MCYCVFLDYFIDIGIYWIGYVKIMLMIDLLNNVNNVVVVGVGIIGMFCVCYLLDQGKFVKLWDICFDVLVLDIFIIDVICGELLVDYWQGVDVLVVSLGILFVLLVIQDVDVCGVKVVGDIELFVQVIQCLVLGVIGFNGKIMVILLVIYIFEYFGIKVVVVGNVGLLVFDVLVLVFQVVVLELLSFQLEIIEFLLLVVVILLNIFVDYFDCYGSFEVYCEVKQWIFVYVVCVVMYCDDVEISFCNVDIFCIEIGFM